MVRKILAMIVLTMLATGSYPASAGEAKPGPYTVGFSEFTLGVAWRVQSNEEFRYASENNPDVKDFIITQAENDVSKQIADIEDLISRKVDLIIINAGSPRALIPVINKAINAGIVVVDFDNATESPRSYHLTIDQGEFGRVGAEWLMKAMGGKGNILVFHGIQGTAASSGRWAGAENVIKQYPDVKVLTAVYGGWDYGTSRRAMESLFAAYPSVDGIYSQGGAMSEAVIDAYLERGLNPPLITGEDNNGFFRAWTEAKAKNPNFDSISTSCPTWISAAAMELGIRVLKGEDVPRDNIVPIPTITAENMNEYYQPDLPSSFCCNTRLPVEIIKKLFSR